MKIDPSVCDAARKMSYRTTGLISDDEINRALLRATKTKTDTETVVVAYRTTRDALFDILSSL